MAGAYDEGQWVQGRQPKAPTTSPGRPIVLKDADASDTIDAACNDPLVNEWTIVVQPSTGTLNDLAAGRNWNVGMQVQLWHDSAQFSYFRGAFNPNPKPVPVVGLTLGVHAQRVRVGMFRVNTAHLTILPVSMAVAIIPRIPAMSVEVQSFAAGPGSPAHVPVPSMARNVRIYGAVSSGDQLDYFAPNDTTGKGGFLMSDNLLGVPIPIQVDSAWLRYTPGGPVGFPLKVMFFEFETWF